MKILHTSDWHIGCKLYNSEFEKEHLLFFDWLIETIISENIDILMIAGDIFDIAYPSNTSLKLYYQILTRLQSTNCKYIFITGGNHDAVSTLNAPKNILEYLNINVIGGVSENIDDEIFKITDADGNLKLIVCAVPFLRDKDVRKSIAGEDFSNRKKAVSDGIVEHYNQIAAKLTEYSNSGIPIIATGHLFINDTNSTSEENENYIGGLQQISYKQFPQIFDYIALGHIHRPQKIGNNDFIRYSGSPIALSFSEINQQKSVVIIEFSEKKPEIKIINVPKFRNIVKFKGTYNHVVAKIEEYKDDAMLKAWADIIISEPNYDPAIFRQIEKYVESVKNIEILNQRIIFEDRDKTHENITNISKSLNEMSEIEIFNQLIEKQGIVEKENLQNTFMELMNNLQI